MRITRARVLEGSHARGGTPEPPTPLARAVANRRIPAAIAAAHADAARIIDDAMNHAGRLEERARERVSDVSRLAAEESREKELARLAATAIYLDARARTYSAAELDRSVELARLLAERIIGAELTLSPERISHLAEELLGEAKGARSARIFGCREDLEALVGTFASLGLPAGTATFEEDPSLGRGSIVIESDVGTVDGRLATRLPLFAAALLEALRHG